LLVAVDRGVATITLNRPSRRKRCSTSPTTSPRTRRLCRSPPASGCCGIRSIWIVRPSTPAKPVIHRRLMAHDDAKEGVRAHLGGRAALDGHAAVGPDA
jgi:hypothetical protein